LIVLLLSASFLLIFLAAEGLYRWAHIAPEWTRKFQHLLSGLLSASFPWILSSPKEIVFLGALMAAALFTLKKSKFLTSLHDVKRETLGEFYFVLSTLILFLLSRDLPPVFYFIPMLILTFSDSLAAIVGTTYKKFTYSIQGHVKSLEGSTAFFISTFLIAHLSLLFLSPLEPLSSVLISLQIAILLTLVEAVSHKGLDNLLIPLVSFALLRHLSPAPIPLMILELIGCLTIWLALITILIYKKRALSIISFPPTDARIRYFTNLAEPIHPQAICLAALKGELPLATLTIQKKGDVGLIGHYEATLKKAGVRLLIEARKQLTQLGAKQILGPLNGNTWNRYRLALDDSHPFFLGEPKNPADYHNHFLEAGFSIIDRYESRIVTELLGRKEAYLRLDARRIRQGVAIESLNMEYFEQTLREIYELSLPAFAENRFYEPITFEEFNALYQKIKPLLDPDFVQLAYDKQRRLIGYAFAYEDAADRSRVIFKTLATDKNARTSGLGVYLYDRIHWIAAEKGKKAVIHALMHDQHNSVKLSKSMNSRLFRSYALYSARIGSR
jgi:dolichol kinase/L-amino acid N-acyltransferase YncA